MIRSFRDRETEKVWNGDRSRRLPGDIQDAALRKLRALDAAERLDDLRLPPGNRLEALTGDRRGQHSIRINPVMADMFPPDRRRLPRCRNLRLPLTWTSAIPLTG